jgi:hypothetical protein
MSSLPVAEAVDNPPPFTPKLGGWHRAPWHKFGDVSEWPPEFKALSTKLDRRRALGEWSLAFAHLKAGTRRNLALCRAEQYNDFASLLEGLVGGGDEDSSQGSWDEKLTEDTRSLCLSTLREKLASVEAHHVPRILDVTFRRLPVAQKQRRAAVSDSSGLVSFEETDGSKQTQSELMDPPTPAETLAATKVLRGLWVLAPQSCAAAANAGAAETLTLALEQGAELLAGGADVLQLDFAHLGGLAAELASEQPGLPILSERRGRLEGLLGHQLGLQHGRGSPKREHPGAIHGCRAHRHALPAR